ncbi:hypothetical protein PLICRDRAFT_338232 [Plicaturopsis crispa FD-325 SS-3]|uniref:Uncharacterized protein n=1 Tax=Plicaturopsis crispa FD-325 SS-3 TaxID=944288 RepID=A0A0C9TAF8_PLICR|nr:hypothetical protein PLICRDRAFT_338232 [Plicaturopsis crispa FD-325 SS-3]
MDFTSDDPELAKELVKLLGQELKTVRAQLRDAQQMARATPSTSVTEDHKDGALLHEIQALRAQNEDLRARSEYLERIAESKPMPFDEDAKHDLLQQLETSRLRADELCREKDEANGALEEALALSQQTEEALVLSQQKRRSAKDSRNEYKTALEEANSRIEEANSQINKANTRLEDTKTHI